MHEKEVISRLLGQPKVEGSESLFFCPYCSYGKKKLSINFTKMKFKCWNCGKGGNNLIRIVFDFGSEQVIEYAKAYFFVGGGITKYNLLLKEEPKLLEPFKNLTVEKLLSSCYDDEDKHVLYLKSRGLTERDFIFWKPYTVKEDYYKDFVFFPSYNTMFNQDYYIGRDITDQGKYKYKTPNKILKDSILFNEYNIDWDKSINLVEGIFDAISCGINSIPLLGSELDTEGKLFEKLCFSESDIYLILDGDAREKAFSMIEKFLKHDVRVKYVQIPYDKDPGKLTSSEIKKYKKNYIIHTSVKDLNLKEKYDY